MFVPLMLQGFSFSSPAVVSKLTGKLEPFSRYNGLEVPYQYFDEAMQRLRQKHLNVPLEAVLHPVQLLQYRRRKLNKRLLLQRRKRDWKWLPASSIVH